MEQCSHAPTDFDTLALLYKRECTKYTQVVPVIEEKDVDGMIVQVGEYGRFQLLVNIMCLLTIPTTYHLTIAVFLTDRSDWRCSQPYNVNSTCKLNSTFKRWGNFCSLDEYNFVKVDHFELLIYQMI